MQRIVTSELDLDLFGSVDLIFQITAAQEMPVVAERLTFRQGEREYTPTEIIDQSGSRLHRLTAEPGPLQVRYLATVHGKSTASRTSDLETIAYLRPSRYSQADEVFAHARRQFGGLSGLDLIAAVSDYVAISTTYTLGLSQGTDSALTTLATGQGVCRDYAHLVIALLRAMDMPARYAACYAPGLEPMDFHAVAEAYFDGTWYVIDATRLANRRSLVRIATGRDAADCAFLSFHGGNVALANMRVDAWVTDDQVPMPVTSDLGITGPVSVLQDGEDNYSDLVQIA